MKFKYMCHSNIQNDITEDEFIGDFIDCGLRLNVWHQEVYVVSQGTPIGKLPWYTHILMYTCSSHIQASDVENSF